MALLSDGKHLLVTGTLTETLQVFYINDREGFTLAAKHEWKCKVTDLVTRPRSKKLGS